MELRKMFALLAASGWILTAAGCGQKGGDSSAGALKATGVLGTASVTGKVTLIGQVPPPVLFSVDADPVCKAQHSGMVKDEIVTADSKGDLKDVLVYVKDGAAVYAAPATAVFLDQKGCLYQPHTFGIQAGQTLEIRNDDATIHNVHCVATINDGFNVIQPTLGMVTDKVFAKAEIPVKFKCDIHGWMHGFAGVFTHPFFAVTGEDGTFKITGLPAGHYTLAAWQEKYGESVPQTIDIKDGEAKSLHFTFTAAAQ